jgi:hypothetical protein
MSLLTAEQRQEMDNKLTLDDLKNALASCGETAPGPDGIGYLYYKKFWNFVGPIILKAWEYSNLTGNLPESHKESIITILPKEGKDLSDIKNWRPITLSNCDAKIITKAISNKMLKVLESIIDPAQTAYVPGRAVSDNLRSNFFYKNYCKKYNVEAILILLDAKKAFDSVNHDYIRDTLEAYGFGQTFIGTFNTLYKDLSARIMVNGFSTEKISIERGVKQGDALSCALFILCIDPLLRNINNNEEIEQVKITNPISKQEIGYKGSAFADDLSVVCLNKQESVQQVFYEYERLTNRSGLELNADKTEFLVLNKATNEKI